MKFIKYLAVTTLFIVSSSAFANLNDLRVIATDKGIQKAVFKDPIYNLRALQGEKNSYLLESKHCDIVIKLGYKKYRKKVCRRVNRPYSKKQRFSGRKAILPRVCFSVVKSKKVVKRKKVTCSYKLTDDREYPSI
jgi:hypothetical protein